MEKIREIEKNKIKVCAMYIIGFPSDDHKTVNSTIEYSKTLNTTYAQFSIWTPYPGTPIFKEFKDKIQSENYENFDQYKVVYKHDKLTSQEIEKYLDYSYASYYARPKWFLKYVNGYFRT